MARGLRHLVGLAAVALAATAPPALGDLAFAPAVDVRTGVDAVDMAALRTPSRPVVAVLTRAPTPGVVAVGIGAGGARDGAIASALAPASVPNALAAADLDGDGIEELVVASGGTDTITVLDVPPALIGLMNPVDNAAGGADPSALAVADFTQDGPLDLAVATDAGIMVLAGDGAGGLAAPVLAVPLADLGDSTQLVGTPPAPLPVDHVSHLATGDLNRDGRPDLVAYAVQPGQSVWRVLLGAAGGGFTTGVLRRALSDSPIMLDGRVDLGDVDGDGTLDAAVTNYQFVIVPIPNVVPDATVHPGTGDGGFLSPPLAPGGLRPIVRRGSVAGLFDLDRDGRRELMAVSGGAATLTIYRDPLGANEAIPVTLPAVAPLAVALDVDADGAADLVTSRGSADGTVGVLLARPVLVGTGQDFGEREVGSAGPVLPVEIENRGVAPFSVPQIAVAGGAASDFAIVDDACSGRVVAGGARCAVRVRFRPTAAGRREAALAVDVALSVAVSGVGVQIAAPPPPPQQPPLPAEVPAARTGCATRTTGGGTRLRCGVVLGPGAAPSRVAVRLLRAGRVQALADMAAGGRVVLTARRPLVAGRYILVTVVVADGRTRQSRSEVTLRS